MSYYQGDMYQGDPGFFSSIFGLGKRLLGFGGGAATSAAPGIVRAAGTGIMKRLPAGVSTVLGRAAGAIGRHPTLSAAGAAGVIGAAGAAIGRHGMVAAGQKGMHISKKTGQLVRNKRMRVTNPRALRRAIRRATGFARLARRVLHFTSPRGPRGRAIFKHRRAKRV